jgi:hypothetical protein
VLAQLLSSAEYRGDLVHGWYLRFLRRDGSPGERAFFFSSLAAGATDEQVIGAIASSDEYFHTYGEVVVPLVSVSPQAVIAVTLPQPATVDVQVFRLISAGTTPVLPGHRGDLARAAAARQVRLPKLKLVGVVHFGKHGKGRLVLHWNRKVGGHKLPRGTYELITRLHAGKKLIALGDPVKFVVR